MSASEEYIFVYGTLRKDINSPTTPTKALFANLCTYYSKGIMQGRLFEIEGYPGAVESDTPGDTVHGELYQIPAGEDRSLLLEGLDDYEECSDQYPQPSEYSRKPLDISLKNGKKVTAWVYIYNRDTADLQFIESGDYLNYLNQ